MSQFGMMQMAAALANDDEKQVDEFVVADIQGTGHQVANITPGQVGQMGGVQPGMPPPPGQPGIPPPPGQGQMQGQMPPPPQMQFQGQSMPPQQQGPQISPEAAMWQRRAQNTPQTEYFRGLSDTVQGQREQKALQAQQAYQQQQQAAQARNTAERDALVKEQIRQMVATGALAAQDATQLWTSYLATGEVPGFRETPGPAAAPKLEKVDLGDRIAMVNPTTGDVVKTYAKGKLEDETAVVKPDFINVEAPDGSTQRIAVDPSTGERLEGFEPITTQVAPAPDNPDKLSASEIAGYRDFQDRITSVGGTIDELENMLEKHGIETFGDNARIMKQMQNDIMLQMKEIYNLGVLNGPDQEILEAVVADPTSFWAKMKDQSANQIELLKKMEGRLARDYGIAQSRLDRGAGKRTIDEIMAEMEN